MMTNAASVTHQLNLVNTCSSTAPSPNMCVSSSEIGQELISPFQPQLSSPQRTCDCQLGAAFKRNRGRTLTLSQFCCIGGFGRRGITGLSKVQAWWGSNSSGQSRKNFAHGARGLRFILIRCSLTSQSGRYLPRFGLQAVIFSQAFLANLIALSHLVLCFPHLNKFGWQTFAGPSKNNSPPNLPPFSAEIRIYLFEL